MRKMFVTLVMSVIIGVAFAQRIVQPITENWKFLRQQATVVSPTDEWQVVALPHSWNIRDGQCGGQSQLNVNGQVFVDSNLNKAKIINPSERYGYYRGPAWYSHLLFIPMDWKNKRIFVRFEAAGQVARVHINGQMLGEHRGAFTAFCYELTNYLQYGCTNDLRVEVDNTHREDIPPLSGDFNVNGGLYRPAELIITNKMCITPLDYASSGVYITTKDITSKYATVEIKTLLSNGIHAAMSNEPPVSPTEITVESVIIDKGGTIVSKSVANMNIAADRDSDIIQMLALNNPILWEGRKNPYLYKVRVNLMKGNKVIDTVEQPLGLRTFAITQSKGFMLNGKSYPIYGVGRHQDMKDKAWALAADDNEKDFRIIKEMGVTAIRFAHYPQSENVHDIADREGFLVWDEIPLVNEVRLDNESKQNIKIMLQEMIHQLYNHPSVAWWGIYNEIENNYTPPSEFFLTELRDIIRKIDPSSRIITGASDHGQRAYNLIPEATCFNVYPGWYHGNFPLKEGYTGELSQFPDWINNRFKELGKRIGISEYGAGGDYNQHTEGKPRKPRPAHGGLFQPEEWLTFVHEEDWRVMQNNEKLWGTFLWTMFDFTSCMRNEGSVPSVNTKGIVSQNRKIKKDPYYMYKANWNHEPMIYIASRRSTKRTLSKTDVKIYSNCFDVTLKVNGKIMGKKVPDEIKLCQFEDITLRKGINRIEAFSRLSNGKKVSDYCEWTLE